MRQLNNIKKDVKAIFAIFIFLLSNRFLEITKTEHWLSSGVSLKNFLVGRTLRLAALPKTSLQLLPAAFAEPVLVELVEITGKLL